MTVPALSNALKSILIRSGVDNPDGDTAEIIRAVTGLSRIDLLTRSDEELDDSITQKAIDLARRRAGGEPIQYVIGSWSFMGRDYLVGKGVLIPRDDTEVVTRASVDLIKPLPHPMIVDLCAGSGIIGVTLKKEHPDAIVYAVEKSDVAYDYLCRNAELNQAQIETIHADLCDCVDRFDDDSLDLIASNPPYIRSSEIETLQSEVQYEPRLALDGGEDGYVFYKLILRLWTKKLRKGGYIAFEIGEGQFDTIAEMLRDHGYTNIKSYPDIQGITRAVSASYSSVIPRSN